MITLSRESPLRLVWMSLRKDGKEIRSLWVFLSVLGGILVSGYLCFAIGSVLAFEATRAIVRIVGGYRSEWKRFLNEEVHKGYRRCKKASSTTSSSSSRFKRHALTGSIESYQVEYSYRCTHRRGNKPIDVKRVILFDKRRDTITTRNNNTTVASASVSHYRKEVVRSLAEYIQRENDFKYQRRRKKDSGDRDEDDSFLVPLSSHHDHTQGSRNLEPFECGVPYGYWMEKRRELLLWSELVEPGVAFFCTCFYFAGCFVQALLTGPSRLFRGSHLDKAQKQADNPLAMIDTEDDEYVDKLYYDFLCSVMLWSVVAVILMIPYCIQEARAVQRKRIRSWKHGGDPLETGATEFDRIKNALRWFLCFGKTAFDSDDTLRHHSWKYYARMEALCAPSFVCGTLLLWLACGPATLVVGYLVVYCTLQWAQTKAPTKKQILQAFRTNPNVLSKVPATATLAPKKDRRKWWVRLQYTVPFPRGTTAKKPVEKDNAIVVTKDIWSDKVHELCQSNPSSTVSVSIHLHPSYPLSGYPTIQLDRDISNSLSRANWRYLCFVTLWVYLVVACSGLGFSFLDYYDEDPFAAGGPEDVVVAGIVLILGPTLLLPGASVLRQIQHDRFLLEKLYEPTMSARSLSGTTN